MKKGLNDKIYDLLEDKIIEILEEVDPESGGFVQKSKPMKRFKSRWRSYLSELDISFMSKKKAHEKWLEPGRIKVHNPLYCEEEAFLIIDMSTDTAQKILLLGLP